MGYGPATFIVSRSIGTLTMYWCSGSRRPRLLFNMAQSHLIQSLLTSAPSQAKESLFRQSKGASRPQMSPDRSFVHALEEVFSLSLRNKIGTAILVPPVHETVSLLLHVRKIAVSIDAIVPPYPGTPARCPPTCDGHPRPSSTA